MFISNVSVDYDARSFQNPGKTITVSLYQGKIFFWVIMMLVRLRLPVMMMHGPLELQKNNHSVTAPSVHILLGSD